MSLINNMLKDLEQREAGIATINYMPSHRAKNSSSWPLHIKILFGLCLLLIAVTLVRTGFSHRKVTQPLSLPHETRIIKSPAAPIADDWKKMINISGVTLQNKDNITELTFLLDHETLYRLVSNEKENQLMIFIDRTKLKSELPPIVYAYTAITKITAKQLKDDTEFILTFAPGASLKDVHVNEIDGNTELVISAISPHHEEVTSPSPDVALLQENISEEKGPEAEETFAKQYQTALYNAEAGHFDLAINKLYELLKMDPLHKEARISLVAILLDQNNIAAAEVLIKDGLKQDPHYAPYAKLHTRIQALRGNNKQVLHAATQNV